MSASRLIIIGAGGHGRVAADCARAHARWPTIAFVDAAWPERELSGRWPVIGNDSTLFEIVGLGDEVFVAIGAAEARRRYLTLLEQNGIAVPSVRHPSAIVSNDTEIEFGCLLAPGAIINVGSRIGLGSIINTGASVDHDCRLGSCVHICPGARLAGDVHVGDSSWIGIGAVVRQGVRIGSGVTVGAGAAVVSDLEDGVTVIGVPARPSRR